MLLVLLLTSTPLELNRTLASSLSSSCQLTWNYFTSPPAASASVSFTEIAAFSPGTLYVSGDYQGYGSTKPVFMRRDSQGWSQLSFGSMPTWFDLLGGTNANDVWAMKHDGTYAMHWNSKDWETRQNLPAGNYVAMAARTPNDIWVAGSTESPSRPSSTMVARWIGKGWRRVPTPNTKLANSTLSGIVVLSRKDAWAVGTGTSGETKRAFVIHWDGKIWQKVKLANNAGASWKAIAAVATNPAAPNLATWTLRSVAAPAADDVWVAGILT